MLFFSVFFSKNGQTVRNGTRVSENFLRLWGYFWKFWVAGFFLNSFFEFNCSDHFRNLQQTSMASAPDVLGSPDLVQLNLEPTREMIETAKILEKSKKSIRNKAKKKKFYIAVQNHYEEIFEFFQTWPFQDRTTVKTFPFSPLEAYYFHLVLRTIDLRKNFHREIFAMTIQLWALVGKTNTHILTLLLETSVVEDIFLLSFDYLQKNNIGYWIGGLFNDFEQHRRWRRKLKEMDCYSELKRKLIKFDCYWRVEDQVRTKINCQHCQKEQEENKPEFKKCSRCNVATYCSKKCQKLEWGMHKLVCGQDKLMGVFEFYW